MKVLLIALESIDNRGDEIIRESTEYLVKQILNDVEILRAQLKPSKTTIDKKYLFCYSLGAILWKLSSWTTGNFSYKIKNLSYVIKYSRYFSTNIRHSDKIILPVGMLKYSTQDFSYMFHLINKFATKYGKPVLMSAMSPQPADNSDWRYLQLIKAVNMPAVCMLTTRDGEAGVNVLSSDYIKRNLHCTSVGDPALWIPEVYRIKGTKTCNEVPYVGINIIRNGIFDDYNKALTDDAMFNIYVQLIKSLEDIGWRWSVFTNGMEKDNVVLRELKKHLGFSEDHVIPPCKNGAKYAEMISCYDVVFGARLHACITSVAVGTPVVGFIWDNKLRHFSETMKITQFFFQPSEMTAEKIVKKMKEALNYNFDIKNRDRYKQKTRDSIKYFLASL